jgi:quercetin dioxygenase-like cupin family protein
MRLLTAFFCALFLSAAAGNPASAASKFVAFGKDVAATPTAAWSEGSTVKSASGADAGKAPKGAVKYTVKAVTWPTSVVRVMTFKKADGGVLHPITNETEFYVLKGAAEFNVNGAPVVLKEGDAATFAKGAVRDGGAADETVIVSWTVGPLTGEPTAAVVRGADVKENVTPALVLKRYDVPGNSIRVVKLIKGNSTPDATAKTDSLIYLTSGKLRFYEADEVHEVVGGDFIWEEAGQKHHWDILENSSFVTTSGLPKGAAPVNPAEATDRR